MTSAACSRSATTDSWSWEKYRRTASDGVETTGVPHAVISKILRAHMDGESTTEFTLRKTRYAL